MEWVTLALGFFGIAAAIVIPIAIEYLKRPRLQIDLADPVDSMPHPDWEMRTVRARVTNEPIEGWLGKYLLRNTANGCTVSVTFNAVDGSQNPYLNNTFKARWSTKPEPYRVGMPRRQFLGARNRPECGRRGGGLRLTTFIIRRLPPDRVQARPRRRLHVRLGGRDRTPGDQPPREAQRNETAQRAVRPQNHRRGGWRGLHQALPARHRGQSVQRSDPARSRGHWHVVAAVISRSAARKGPLGR